jgi:hypothetical protein
MTQLHFAAPFTAAICFIPKYNKLISKTHDNQGSQKSSGPIRNYYHLWLLTYEHKEKYQASVPIWR